MTFEEWWERRGPEALHMTWTEDACRFAWQAALATPAAVAPAVDARAEQSEGAPVPPRWYTVEEITHYLKCMNYSDHIAAELATWFTRHLQLAFDKGFEKGYRAALFASPPKMLTDEVLVQLFYAAQGDITRFRVKARELLEQS